VSFDRITELLQSAEQTLVAAALETGPVAKRLRFEAQGLRTQAAEVAEQTKPGVIHNAHGYGVLLGVTAKGLAEVTFGGEPFAVALPISDLKEAW
jgi:hypothetical protein